MKLSKKREIKRNFKESNIYAIDTTIYSVSKKMENTFIDGLFFIKSIPIHFDDLRLDFCVGCPKYIEELQVKLDKGEITQEDFEYSSKFDMKKCENPSECILFFDFREEVKACIYEDYKVESLEEHKLKLHDLEFDLDLDDLGV